MAYPPFQKQKAPEKYSDAFAKIDQENDSLSHSLAWHHL